MSKKPTLNLGSKLSPETQAKLKQLAIKADLPKEIQKPEISDTIPAQAEVATNSSINSTINSDVTKKKRENPQVEAKKLLLEKSEYKEMLSLVNSTLEDVAIKQNISSDTIGKILTQEVSKSVNWKEFQKLGLIGVDEIAVRKGYNNYLSIITSKVDDKVRILAVLEGREKAEVKAFLKTIPSRLKRKITGYCCDMNEGYINASLEALKSVPIIIDRFHVAKLYRKCLVELRQSELVRLRKKLGIVEYKELKSSISILRRNAELVSEMDRNELEKLFKHSPKLHTAYCLCRQLTSICNSRINRRDATTKIDRWIKKVEASNMRCFDTFVKTLSKYRIHIIQYFKGRYTSGFVEGFNNKIKVIKRRCYGISDANSLFRRIFLDTEGYARFLNRTGVAMV